MEDRTSNQTQRNMVAMELIDQGYNSRLTMDVSELMVQIQTVGQLEPIGLFRKANGRYDITYGNRRFNAIKKLGHPKIWADVTASDTESTRLLKNLIENIGRVDVPISDLGLAFEKLIDAGLTLGEISAKIGRSVSHIKHTMEHGRDIPAEYKDKVVASGPGKKKAKGFISGNVSKAIVNLTKSGLSSANKIKLYSHARANNTGHTEIESIGRRLLRGDSFEQAVKNEDTVKRVGVVFTLSTVKLKKIEARHAGQKLKTIILDLVKHHLGI